VNPVQQSTSRANRPPVEVHAVGKVSWLFLLLLGIAVLLVIRFLFVYAVRYWSFDPYGDAYWPRRYGLVMHLVGGSVAILTGPVPLVLGEARFFPAWHRAMGKVYLAAVTLGCLSGYYLALTSRDVGWVFASGLFGLAVAWTIRTGMAYLAIRLTIVLTISQFFCGHWRKGGLVLPTHSCASLFCQGLGRTQSL
jgi:Predicted membrane protein (DUF2306)